MMNDTAGSESSCSSAACEYVPSEYVRVFLWSIANLADLLVYEYLYLDMSQYQTILKTYFYSSRALTFVTKESGPPKL